MALYYVTGISGAGKSSVKKELLKRGFTAFDIDEDRLASYFHNITGEKTPNTLTATERTPEWRKNHTWKLPRQTVEKLLKASDGNKVFLCGVTANDADELWDLFDKVFALTISDEVLKHRILNRTNNDFGKSFHEMEALLNWQKTASEDYKKLNAVLIDSTKSVEIVVDDILSYINNR